MGRRRNLDRLWFEHDCQRCGHGVWDHCGFHWPGCTFLATCRCPEFVPDPDRPGRPFTWPTWARTPPRTATPGDR